MTTVTEEKSIGQLYRERLVDHVKAGISDNDNVFLISYSKVSGISMSDLRKDLKQTGAQMYIAKNSIARLAFKDSEQKKLGEKIEGQSALVWGGNDSAEVSKVLVKFVKDAENIILRGGLLQGRLLAIDDIKRLSELPSRTVLLSMLLSAVQSPLTRLAGALNAKTRDLVSVLKQLSEKKGGS